MLPTGAGVGKMGAINIVGGIAGSLSVGFGTLPGWGIQTSLFAITGLSLLIGSAAWWRLEKGFLGDCVLAGRRSRVCWVAIPYFCGTRLPQDFLAIEGTLVDFREGSCQRLRRAQERRAPPGNQSDVARPRPQEPPGYGRAYPGPAARGPAIGPGDRTGNRSDREFFLFHDVLRLDCVEIEDGLIDLVARYFDSAWMQDPRVHLIVEDGRNYVTHTRDRYDLISIEVGQIYRPRVASFYTADFYRRLHSRLRPGGLACQFLPIGFFGTADFRTLLATFLEVFPQSVLWYNTSELLLIGTEGSPIAMNPQRLETLVAGNPGLKWELDYAYWGGPNLYLSRPEVFFAGFLCGREQLRELSQGAGVYRDDRPYLEYVSLLGSDSAAEIVALLRRHLSPVRQSSGRAATSRWLPAAPFVSRICRRFWPAWPSTAVKLWRCRSGAGRHHRIPARLAEMPDDPTANFNLAIMLQSQGRQEDAIVCYRPLATNPNNFGTLYNLAVALAAKGELAEAQQLFRRAVAEQPGHARPTIAWVCCSRRMGNWRKRPNAIGVRSAAILSRSKPG